MGDEDQYQLDEVIGKTVGSTAGFIRFISAILNSSFTLGRRQLAIIKRRVARIKIKSLLEEIEAYYFSIIRVKEGLINSIRGVLFPYGRRHRTI